MSAFKNHISHRTTMHCLTSVQQRWMRTYGTLVARVLMGLFFFIAGYSKLADIKGTAGYIENGAGLPAPELLAYLTVALEIGGGLALILGFAMPIACAALALFALATAYLFHGPSLWAANPMQQIMFMKNIAIAAGLIYMLAYGPGDRFFLRNGSPANETPSA